MSDGKLVALQPVRLEQGTDVDHSIQAGGKTGTTERWTGLPTPNIPFLTCLMPMSPRAETKPYWTLARQYTLGDRMFQSNSGPSFPAHQYMIAGQSAEADENPSSTDWGCDTPQTARVRRIHRARRTTIKKGPQEPA
jgi:phospholipase C